MARLEETLEGRAAEIQRLEEERAEERKRAQSQIEGLKGAALTATRESERLQVTKTLNHANPNRGPGARWRGSERVLSRRPIRPRYTRRSPVLADRWIEEEEERNLTVGLRAWTAQAEVAKLHAAAGKGPSVPPPPAFVNRSSTAAAAAPAWDQRDLEASYPGTCPHTSHNWSSPRVYAPTSHAIGPPCGTSATWKLRDHMLYCHRGPFGQPPVTNILLFI
eukprot:3917631-Pyramimonas_sp.AAC.1